MGVIILNPGGISKKSSRLFPCVLLRLQTIMTVFRQMYQKAAKGLIKYITLAPEHDEDFALTKYCKETGVVVSMGHSSATYEQALMGIANGATSMTHVFNGMTAFHHRKPGLVGTAMRVRDIYGEVISDGCHSHLAALNDYVTAKGRDFTIMITDSLRPKHCPPGGEYDLGGHAIEISETGLVEWVGKGTTTVTATVDGLVFECIVRAK